MKESNAFHLLNQKIVECKKCPRLYSYIRTVAKNKVKRFKDEKYWGKPLTGFGDINAELLIIGLAPAAHGGNRTGRMFTGDSSGDWLARVLYEFGFANKTVSQRINDGFQLTNAYITASVRCAPPENKPSRNELDNCFVYLQEELNLLRNVRVIICLGKIAFESCSKLLGIKSAFSHGKVISHEKFGIISSYHPSRQNTQTGRLVWEQWLEIFSTAKTLLDKNN